MTQQTVYPYGAVEVTVPLTQKIAISTNGGGYVSIFYLIENANRPDAWQLQQTINNEEVELGTFSVVQKVRIETKSSPALYDIGASPVVGVGDASTLNGYSQDSADTADTIVLRDSSGDIAANAFESTVTTGTAPLTVASTTEVTNLNADYVNGEQANDFVHKTGNETVGGNKTISNGIILNNNIAVKGKETGGTERIIIQVGSDDHGYLGVGALPNYVQGTTLLFTGILSFPQGAPTAKTTDDTLTAAEIAARIITVENGAAGTTTLTLPLGTDFETYFSELNNNTSIEFSVINISTVAGEDCTIATNTGWTLFGSMVIEARDSDRANSSGRFVARRTATNTFRLYRIS